MAEMKAFVRLGRGGINCTETMADQTRKETAKEIDSVAADWAARLDRGGLSPAEDLELETWLASDPRRAGAFAKARAVSLYSERARALGPTYDPASFEPKPDVTRKPGLSRRGFLWSGTAAAACTGAVVMGGVAWSSRGEAYETLRGQMKIVPLSDGSVISLNTASRIRVVFTPHKRTVHLDEGEALFDVARDRNRPFIVLAGQTRVLAASTSFAVRHLADAPVEVLVREGIVEVNAGALEVPGVQLGANMRASAEPEDGHVELASAMSVAPVEVQRAMAWREGRISFEGQTLREAVAEFRRYSDTSIIIDDPAIANEPITGLFQVNDPVGFARAVADSFSLRADVGEKQVRLHR